MDTIAAIATPFGRGGIGIIRISGSEAVKASQRLIEGNFPKPRFAAHREFVSVQGIPLDQGLVIFFPAPHSFTGEDVVEFQAHGSQASLNNLLKNLRLQGVRDARPGEFSERAFLNGRIDLTQAEAIADLIDASSSEAAQAAARSLKGAFSEKVNAIHQQLIGIRTQVEAAIDFSDEDIELLSQQELINNLKQCYEHLTRLMDESKQGLRLQQGVRLVIAGKPNAGKSSLLNALAGRDVAIVSRVAGTTRDVVTTDLLFDGLPLHVLDTAGLHETEDEIEKEGIRRAMEAIKQADQILWIVDSTKVAREETVHDLPKLLTSVDNKKRVILIRNKADLSHEPTGVCEGKEEDLITLSATTREGFLEFKNYLQKKVGYNSAYTGFSARERHIVALKRALALVFESLHNYQDLEITSELLKDAHQAIGEITGAFTTEDLLGRIFSSFCIGK